VWSWRYSRVSATTDRRRVDEAVQILGRGAPVAQLLHLGCQTRVHLRVQRHQVERPRKRDGRRLVRSEEHDGQLVAAAPRAEMPSSTQLAPIHGIGRSS